MTLIILPQSSASAQVWSIEGASPLARRGGEVSPDNYTETQPAAGAGTTSDLTLLAGSSQKVSDDVIDLIIIYYYEVKVSGDLRQYLKFDNY